MIAPIIPPESTTEQEPKLPDQIADAWAAVLIDIYQRLKKGKTPSPSRMGRPHDRHERRLGRVVIAQAVANAQGML